MLDRLIALWAVRLDVRQYVRQVTKILLKSCPWPGKHTPEWTA